MTDRDAPVGDLAKRTCNPNASPGKCSYSYPQKCRAPQTHWINDGPDRYWPLCEVHALAKFHPKGVRVFKGTADD